MEDEPGVPSSLEAAWGLRERPGKGPRRALTLDGIVEAALAVGTAEGLPAVSMSRVAAELGVSTMALYRYVTSKDELLMLMMDAVIGLPPADVGPRDGWRAGMSAWAWAMREVLQRRPWTLHVPIQGPPLTPNNVAWMEAGLSCMRGTVLSAGEKLGVLLLVSGYVRNQVMLTADLAAAYASPQGAETAAGYGRLLARLTDPVRFPELHAVIASEVLDGTDDDLEEDFAFGLSCVLNGVEALMRSPGRPGE